MEHKIIDFNGCVPSNRCYGGNAGAKLGVVYDGEPWLLKFPQSTKDNRTREISYTTSPLSEYLGSHIYGLIGLPVHETVLGVYSGKLVVGCKDFLEDGEALQEFSKIKNIYFPSMDEDLEEHTSFGSSTNLADIKVVMQYNPVFLENSAAKERFWDMFVVDALIGNRDRNNGNWGFIRRNNQWELAPVYDNGNSFANKAGDEKMGRLVGDLERLRHSALKTGVCVFQGGGKPINPYVYIGSCQDEDLNDALLRIVPRINMEDILSFLDSVPGGGPGGLTVISDVRREYYKQLISVRYEEALWPAFIRVCAERGIDAEQALANCSALSGGQLEVLLGRAREASKQTESLAKGACGQDFVK